MDGVYLCNNLGVCEAVKNLFKKFKDSGVEQTNVIQMSNIPLTTSGEPDIQAILAANGLSHIDASKATVVMGNADDKDKMLEAINKMSRP